MFLLFCVCSSQLSPSARRTVTTSCVETPALLHVENPICPPCARVTVWRPVLAMQDMYGVGTCVCFPPSVAAGTRVATYKREPPSGEMAAATTNALAILVEKSHVRKPAARMGNSVRLLMESGAAIQFLMLLA